MISRLVAGIVFLVGVVASVADAAILHGPVINPANGRAYYLLEADTWQGSAAQANALGGHLVVINDQVENEWVVTTFGRHAGEPRNLWLGLSDAAKEGTFEWMTREPLSFTGWKAGEPDNSQAGENYAFMLAPGEGEGNRGGTWADTLNSGDGGQIPFHAVVETAHSQNDNLARWLGVPIDSYRNNPWDIWTYPSLGFRTEQPSLRIWQKSSGANARLNLGSEPAGSPLLQPYEIVLEPTANDFISATWSAQMAGTYSVEVSFTDIDDAGDGQDVHVSVNGVAVFTSKVNAAEGNRLVTYRSPAPVQLAKGQSVTVRVGSGGAGHDAVGDVTRVDATIHYQNTAVTHFEGTSGRLRLDDAGNVVLTLGTSDLTYDANGSLISKGPAAPLEEVESDYVQVSDGKIRKYSGSDNRLIWEVPLDSGYARATSWYKLDSQGNVLLPVVSTGGVPSSIPYLIKYAAANGQRQWIASATTWSSYTHYVTDLATDKNDDIVIVSIDMFGAPSVRKLSGASGQFLWSKNISPLGAQRYLIIHYYDTRRNEQVYNPKCIFDADNNPIVFGGVNAMFLYDREDDAYAFKLAANTGTEFWQRIWRSPNQNHCWGALVDSHGDIILAQSGSFMRYKAPPINSQYVTFQGHTAALVHARVRVSDPQATMYVEYGTNASYGNRTPEVPVPADGIAKVLLGGLTAPNVYHYRLVVETSDGVIAGEGQTFSTSLNQKPVAEADSYVEPAEGGLTQFIINVLANDGDPDGDSINIVSVTQGRYGTVTTDGSMVVYKPSSAFVTDTFAYTIADSYNASATATVTVRSNELPPVAVDDSVQPSPGPFDLFVLKNDYDPEGKPLTIVSVAQPVSGTVNWTGGLVRYTPKPGFAGDDQFTYVVSDGSLTAQATVRVTVLANLPPVAVDDIAESRPSGVRIYVLSNDSDPEGKPLTIRMLDMVQPAHGSVTSNFGALYYKPHPRFVGIDQFTYSISDGVLSSTATVTVTVEADENGEVLSRSLFLTRPSWESKFRRFGVPSINDRGEVAFQANFSKKLNVNSEVVSGLFIYTGSFPQRLTWITQKGQRAPDASGTDLPKGEEFRSFQDPLLNGRGDVAFLATISASSLQRDSGIWIKPLDGRARMVVREGDPATGVDGARLGTFISLGLTDSGAVPFVAKLRAGKGGATAKNALGLWITTESGTHLLLRQGDTIEVGGASKQVKLFAALTTPSNSPGHERLGAGEALLVRVTWSDKTHSILRVSPSTAPEILVSSGDEAPGTAAKFASFGLPSPDHHGGFAISATLQGEGVTSTNDVCVYACTAEGNWELLARESETEALELERSQPVRNAEGRTAFLLTSRTTGAEEIWSAEDGLIFAEGEEQPSSQPRSVVSLAYPGGEHGGAVYLARSESNASGKRKRTKKAQASRVGLWAIDDTGTHHLLCEAGEKITVSGQTKTIRAIDTLRAVPGSAAQPRSYNSKGQIVYRLTFTDGSQAIFQRQLP